MIYLRSHIKWKALSMTVMVMLLSRFADKITHVGEICKSLRLLFLMEASKIYFNNNIAENEKNNPLYRLHTAFLHWPLSSAATKEVQGPDTT
jgi:hypothetical protein